MTPEAMDRMAEAYFEAVCAGDAEGLRALFAHDVRWRIPKGAIPPYGGVHRGADTVVEMMLGAVGASFVEGSQRFEVATTLIGLLPIMFGSETGTRVMKRIAAPMVGGLISSTILTLVVLPAVYLIWKSRQIDRTERED